MLALRYGSRMMQRKPTIGVQDLTNLSADKQSELQRMLEDARARPGVRELEAIVSGYHGPSFRVEYVGASEFFAVGGNAGHAHLG